MRATISHSCVCALSPYVMVCLDLSFFFLSLSLSFFLFCFVSLSLSLAAAKSALFISKILSAKGRDRERESDM